MLNTEFIKKVKEVKKNLQHEERPCYVYSRSEHAYFEIYEVYVNNVYEIIIDSE